mmetsp:Transcript_86607/g.181453  ORF Transcript_86607/g.181453 Transcript_86607/m.181453 type:complete len:358 (-) Transcript_86607:703-1776(-)
MNVQSSLSSRGNLCPVARNDAASPFPMPPHNPQAGVPTWGGVVNAPSAQIRGASPGAIPPQQVRTASPLACAPRVMARSISPPRLVSPRMSPTSSREQPFCWPAVGSGVVQSGVTRPVTVLSPSPSFVAPVRHPQLASPRSVSPAASVSVPMQPVGNTASGCLMGGAWSYRPSPLQSRAASPVRTIVVRSAAGMRLPQQTASVWQTPSSTVPPTAHQPLTNALTGRAAAATLMGLRPVSSNEEKSNTASAIAAPKSGVDEQLTSGSGYDTTKLVSQLASVIRGLESDVEKLRKENSDLKKTVSEVQNSRSRQVSPPTASIPPPQTPLAQQQHHQQQLQQQQQQQVSARQAALEKRDI